MLKIFKLDDGEAWWVAAYDTADALEIGKTMDIGTELDDGETVEVTELSPDEPLRIALTDGYNPEYRDDLPADPERNDEKGYWTVTATVKEWAAVAKRGDCICSTLY